MRVRRLLAAAAAAAALTTACNHSPDAPGKSPATSTGPAAATAGAGVVYVEDRTGDDWPVDVAVRQWDAGLAADVRYGPCPDLSARCIKVREGGAFGDDMIGKTTVIAGIVRMNPAFAGLPAAQRLAAVCHELGHALGLSRHNEDTDSCMHAQIDDTTSTRPGHRDLDELNARDGDR